MEEKIEQLDTFRRLKLVIKGKSREKLILHLKPNWTVLIENI